MEDAEARILCGVFVENRAGVVGGAVIDANRLPVGEGLGENRVQTLAQIWRDVIDGDDDGEEWSHESERVGIFNAEARRRGVRIDG